MIDIKELVKKYDDITVLDSIDLTIEKGEIFGIIGRSGAGKSTLLRCINGLEPFERGSMIVDGVEVSNLSYHEMLEHRKNIGMIFQQFSLLERLNSIENVALQMKLWKVPKAERLKKAMALLDLVGLSDKAYSYPRELSGGQKQRVAIARSLSMDPKILLCDEATSALDPKSSESIVSLLMDINRELGITIVIVTHEMSVIKSCCNRMTIIEDGKLARTGAVEDVFIEQSPPLLRLLGDSGIVFPRTGCNYKIIMTEENSDKPLITDMGRELGVNVVVLGGELEKFRQHTLGTIYINTNSCDSDKVQQYFDRHNIHWNYVNREAGEES